MWLEYQKQQWLFILKQHSLPKPACHPKHGLTGITRELLEIHTQPQAHPDLLNHNCMYVRFPG